MSFAKGQKVRVKSNGTVVEIERPVGGGDYVCRYNHGLRVVKNDKELEVYVAPVVASAEDE